MVNPKTFKAGGTITETNSRLADISRLLNSLLDAQSTVVVTRRSAGASIDVGGIINALGPLATQTTLADVLSALGPLATQATLADVLAKIIAAPATEAKQDVQETSLDAIIAKLIASPATEAKQDDMESSLNTIITQNAANWLVQLAAMVVDAAASVLILLDIIVRAASDVIRNSRLGEIRDSTATSATRLATIVTSNAAIVVNTGNIASNTSTISSRTLNIENAVEGTGMKSSDVGSVVIDAGDQEYHLRPDASTDTAQIWACSITNVDGVFPVTFMPILSDGTNNVPLISQSLVLGASATGTLEFTIPLDLRRDMFLIIQASIAGAHTFRSAFIHNGPLTESHPT